MIRESLLENEYVDGTTLHDALSGEEQRKHWVRAGRRIEAEIFKKHEVHEKREALVRALGKDWQEAYWSEVCPCQQG